MHEQECCRLSWASEVLRCECGQLLNPRRAASRAEARRRRRYDPAVRDVTPPYALVCQESAPSPSPDFHSDPDTPQNGRSKLGHVLVQKLTEGVAR